MTRKLLFPLLLCLLLSFCTLAAADTVSFGTRSFDTSSEFIDLGQVQVTDFDAFYTFLDSFTDLKKVNMFETPVYRPRIEEMAERYPDIEFGWTMRFAEHEVRTDITAYSTLHMSNAKTHGNADIALVRFCRHLKALDIGHNAVSDLSFLYELPELRVLIIACNKVEDITPIGSLKNLEYLEMFTNNVRDITPLTDLDHLMDLNISYNYIADISPIFTLKNLRRLWTCRSVNRGMDKSLTNSQISQLMEYFPDLELNNVSNPTGGTWREHPHFDVIHAMFRTGVYVPFEDSFTGTGDEETLKNTVTVKSEPDSDTVILEIPGPAEEKDETVEKTEESGGEKTEDAPEKKRTPQIIIIGS